MSNLPPSNPPPGQGCPGDDDYKRFIPPPRKGCECNVGDTCPSKHKPDCKSCMGNQCEPPYIITSDGNQRSRNLSCSQDCPHPPDMEQYVRKYISDLIECSPVLIVSGSKCPYCKDVRETFEKYCVTYRVLEVDMHPYRDTIMDYIMEETGGKSIPRIFIFGDYVGGADDLKLMEKNGELQKLFQPDRGNKNEKKGQVLSFFPNHQVDMAGGSAQGNMAQASARAPCPGSASQNQMNTPPRYGRAGQGVQYPVGMYTNYIPSQFPANPVMLNPRMYSNFPPPQRYPVPNNTPVLKLPAYPMNPSTGGYMPPPSYPCQYPVMPPYQPANMYPPRNPVPPKEQVFNNPPPGNKVENYYPKPENRREFEKLPVHGVTNESSASICSRCQGPM